MESLKRSFCLKCCFVSLVVALLLSLMLPFIMIPIAFRIRDESGNTVIPASAAAELVKLTTVDGLWYWMVVASSDQLSQLSNVSLVLSDRLETVWRNTSGVSLIASNTLTLLDHVYALPGSVISATLSPDNVTTDVEVVQINGGENATVCSSQRRSMLTCHINQTGYYSVVVTTPHINTTVSYKFSLKNVDPSYYNSTVTSFLECTLNQSNHVCRFELDDLTDYHLLGTFGENSTRLVDIVIGLTIEGRLTWYSVLILLCLPLIITVLLVAAVCLFTVCSHD